MEEKINNLVKQRAPWLAKKNLVSILILTSLKNCLDSMKQYTQEITYKICLVQMHLIG